jgi:hypothetical protein
MVFRASTDMGAKKIISAPDRNWIPVP